MRRIPVDTRNIRCVSTDPAQAKTDQEGVIKTDREGRPLQLVPVLVMVEGEKSETLIVSVPGPVPTLPEFVDVEFVGLTAQAWSMSGRSGVAFAAESVRVAGGAAAPKGEAKA